MVKPSRVISTLACLAFVPLLSLAAAPIASAASVSESTPGSVAVIDGIETNAPVDTPSELYAFIGSDAPKTVEYFDGEIQYVGVGAPEPEMSTLALPTRSPCASTDTCLQRSVPLSSIGLYGYGVHYTTYGSVNTVKTGNAVVRLAILGRDNCVTGNSVRFGPNTSIATSGTVCMVERTIFA